MGRPTPAQRMLGREAARSNAATVIRAYRDGRSMNSLADDLGVSPFWLSRQFDIWGEPRRGPKEARALLVGRHPKRRAKNNSSTALGEPRTS